MSAVDRARAAVSRARRTQVTERPDDVRRRVMQERAAVAALHPRSGTVVVAAGEGRCA